MDVPYNKSGASCREHYRIVRNVENAPHQTEQLVRQEVQRIQQLISGKKLSTSELRKNMIILLYCMNSSFGSVSSETLAFALPSAVHLAEAGSKVREKRIGYLFCWEVMPRDHELQLMLVNTVRKDLMSSSVPRINLALETLVKLPSADVVPAVQARCIELLSHPSPRIRVSTMHALQSLAQFAPDLLNEEKIRDLVIKRLSDADESVIRAALRFSLSLSERNLLSAEKIMRTCMSLLSRLSDRWTARNYSSGFSTSIFSAMSSIYENETDKFKDTFTNELLPSVLTILRRAVKHDQKPLILECFRLLGRIPSAIVARYITEASSQPTESAHLGEGSERSRAHFIHPVFRIRHFLSSRVVNDHYLFLSCIARLDPSLWAGIAQASEDLLVTGDSEQNNNSKPGVIVAIPLVLDQLEVERVLSFLASVDEQIRLLTLRVLISLDPSLVETCYSRTLEALRTSSSTGLASNRTHNVQRLVELAFCVSLGNEKIEVGNRGQVLVQKLREVVDIAGGPNHVDATVVESVLNHIRRQPISIQHSFILCLLPLLQADATEHQQIDARPPDATLFLILVALTCELASVFASSRAEVVSIICLFAASLQATPLSMQEPLLLCMTRFTALLSPNELSSLEMEDARRVVHDFSETCLADKKKFALIKRCEQFEKTLANPDGLKELLGNKEDVSLPEFAFALDHGAKRSSLSPTVSPAKSLSPPSNVSSPKSNHFKSPLLSHSKLRYDAYAPPPAASSTRLLRVHSQSSSASNRSSSRASSSRLSTEHEDTDLSKTVTAGELTLVAGGNEFAKAYSSNKGKIPEVEHVSGNIIDNDTPVTDAPSSLLSLDSPFLPEPLVDVKDVSKPIPVSSTTPPPVSSSYVSANASLRNSPEPAQNFEMLWSELDAFKARGWCEDAVDGVVRRLQGLRLHMDMLDADTAPFEGDLKISLRPSTIVSATPSAVLRLHEEDDGSCLWQARGSDREFVGKVKELLK